MILSICIPSYNRCDSLLILVNSLLRTKLNNIEVIILDNCSTDKTVENLSKIHDSRLQVYCNDKNIGGINNSINVLSYGVGDYILFCLDKDFIETSLIDRFFSFLQEYDTIVAGNIALNLTSDRKNEFYGKGFESLSKIAFCSRHPTGLFFKRSMLIDLNVNDILKQNNIYFHGFFWDFILADFCMRGETAIINWSGLATETATTAARKTSYSYSQASTDIFFFPQNRYKTYTSYIRYARKFHLSHRDFFLLSKRIISDFYKVIHNDVLVFKNDEICRHYGISSRNISAFKMLIINIKYTLLLIHDNSLIFNPVNLKCVITIHTDELVKMAKNGCRAIKRLIKETWS